MSAGQVREYQNTDPLISVKPTNAYWGQEHWARIMFPIAGHPEFDKGAYHHPIGLCCYTVDRKNRPDELSGILGWLIALPCYVGTLCYQPCGIICAHQFPWMGDCPFTEQRVTQKFVNNFPGLLRSQSPMILTTRGSANQCVFERAKDLRNGENVHLRLLSHSDKAITKRYPGEKRYGPWRYIESECGDADDAIMVRYVDGQFIMLVEQDLVLDVAFWRMDQGNVVNFVGGTSNENNTKKGGGGRDWLINDDGTISAKHHPHLVLGV